MNEPEKRYMAVGVTWVLDQWERAVEGWDRSNQLIRSSRRWATFWWVWSMALTVTHIWRSLS